MRAILRDNKHVYLDTLSDAESQILWEAFTFEDPNAYAGGMNAARSWQNKYRKYDRINKRVVRTFLGRLAFACKKHDLPFHVEDHRPKWKYTYIDEKLVDEDFLPGIKLEDYQIAAIKKGIKCECGIFDMVTGGGKTEVIAGLCKAIHCPTLILADMTVVVSQIRERLQLREVASEIGMFFAGEKPNGEQIVIGSIQSLNPPKPPKDEPQEHQYKTEKTFKQAYKRWESSLLAYETRKRNYKMLMEYVKNAEMLIVDECVDEDSLIHTNIGLITAGQLYDKIVSGEQINMECLGGNHRIVGCSEKMDDSLRINTVKSRELITSQNHKFATFDNGQRVDKYASDLRIGDLLLVNHHNYANKFTLDNKDDLSWYFAGLFIGDGHMQNYSQIKFGIRKDFDDWIRVCEDVSEHFVGEFTHSFNNREDLVLRFKSQELIEFIRGLGFSKGRKMGSIDPKFFVPKDQVSNLLRGLFDAEGSASHDCCQFDSSDKLLSVFVQNCLSYLGIVSNLFISNHRDNKKHEKCWRVSITSSQYQKFQNLVGFGFSRKIKDSISDELIANPFIDSKIYVSKWRKYLSLKVIKDIVGPIPPKEISLQKLVLFQNKINNHLDCVPETFNEAKKKFCISYQKVADYHGLPLMSTFLEIKNKNKNHLWLEYVEHIKEYFSSIQIDTSIDGYVVEPVKSVAPGGKRRLIDFTVEGVSSFNANGFLVHNCDRSNSSTYKQVIRKLFKGRRRYGFSGTPFDESKPIANLNIEENFGYIIFQMKRKEVEARGRIIPLRYRMLVYEDPQFDLHNKIALDEATDMFMVENKRFHDLILAIVGFHAGEKNMILVDRIPLGENLLQAARANGMKAGFIYGKTPKRERTDYIDRFAAGDLDVLIGGKIVNRGLDVKGGVDNLIMAAGGKLRSDFLQKIGRALRVNNRGFSYVYDVLFRCNHYLYEHGKARLKTIVDAEYDSVVNFGHNTIDGPSLIKRNFRPPAKPKAGQRRIKEETLFHQRDS